MPTNYLCGYQRDSLCNVITYVNITPGMTYYLYDLLKNANPGTDLSVSNIPFGTILIIECGTSNANDSNIYPGSSSGDRGLWNGNSSSFSMGPNTSCIILFNRYDNEGLCWSRFYQN